MAESESPEDAAAVAAFKEAENAQWPPTRNNARAVGAAAGGAAAAAGCAAIGAAVASPLCAAIGSEVGDYVGGVFYDLADSFFGANEATRLLLDSLSRRATIEIALAKAGQRLCTLRRGECEPFTESIASCIRVRVKSQQDRPGPRACYGAGISSEVNRLHYQWELPEGRGYTWDIRSDGQLQAQLKRIAAAESASAAAIIVEKAIAGEKARREKLGVFYPLDLGLRKARRLLLL